MILTVFLASAWVIKLIDFKVLTSVLCLIYVKNGYAVAFVNTPGIWSFVIIIIIVMQGDQF